MTVSTVSTKSGSASEARNRLVEFYNGYGELVAAKHSGRIAEAEEIRGRLAHSSLAVQRDLEKVGQGFITMMEAPALGGRRWPARLTDVVLTHLADEYNIRPDMVLVILRQAIGEYERRSLGGNRALTQRRSLVRS